jgi:hypothetical protein
VNAARTLTEDQWHRKAAAHVRWDASHLAELQALGEQLDRENEIPPTKDAVLASLQALIRISRRIEALQQRCEQLHRVMARHLERAPPSLRPDLDHALRTGNTELH